jgi:hypothetical protein
MKSTCDLVVGEEEYPCADCELPTRYAINVNVGPVGLTVALCRECCTKLIDLYRRFDALLN